MRCASLALIAVVACSAALQGGEPIAPEQFDELQQMILPQPGENRFWQVPWVLDIHQARQQAAAEGKPIFVWSGYRTTPLGDCRQAVAASRSPQTWNEEFTRLIKERCAGLAIHSPAARKREDSQGDFIRRADLARRALTSTFGMELVSAGGEHLGPVYLNTPGVAMKSLKDALQKFDELPESKRAPGAVKIGKQGPVDEKFAPLTPPEGCLIVHVYNRFLGRREDGGLRYVVASDYAEKDRHAAPLYAQPFDDFMWVPRQEWQALVPAEPREGAAVPVPEAFALRLFRYQLNPRVGFTEGPCYSEADLKSGDLKLTVEEVTLERVELLLQGHAKLRQRHAPDYDPAILGRLTYDRQRKAFTRFDIVALGDMSGGIQHGGAGFREGDQPFAVAMRLVSDLRPADMVPPGGAIDPDYLHPR